MKKMFIFFFVFFVIHNSAFSVENNFFKYGFGGYSSAINVENGNNLFLIESYYNLENKQLIKDCYINVKNNEKSSFFHLEYENGLEVREYSKVYESRNEFYLYNENNNLISISNKEKFNYISNDSRQVFILNKLREVQEIEAFSEDYIKLHFIEYTSKLNEDAVFVNKIIDVEYFYDNGRLIYFEVNSWNKNNVHSEFVETLNFFYDEENRLIKTVQGYGPEDVRCIRNMLYDEENRIKRINITYYEQQRKQNESVEFSAYDINGNWRECKIYKDLELTEQITREINYIE